ncbi:MAG: potassium channel protein [Chloroflexi bacterium]|nr:potassium channel protein [Chloroflexota bacterium]
MLFRLINTVVRLIRTALEDPVRSFEISLLTLAVLTASATLVYMIIEGMSATDALYMTIITITTVGFGEVTPLSPAGRVFTVILILLGVGTTTTAISTAIGIVLGPRLWLSIRQRRMERLLMEISNHYVVCGYGRMGRQVIEDLRARDEPFVLIDRSDEIQQELIQHGFPHVIGDATHDESLLEAGIKRARGMIAALDTDPDNVMTVMTARELNPRLFIVARVSNAEAERKLIRAGANRVVSPYQIGGHRLALALLRPAVNDFLDRIFNFHVGMDMDIGQLHVHAYSRLAGQTVATCELRTTHHVSILAIQQATGELVVTPRAEQMIEPGAVLLVIGPSEQIYHLEKEFIRQD